MTRYSIVAILVAAGLVLAGCSREPGSTKLTSGTLTVECDEAVFPAMNVLAADFRQQYPDARIDIRCVEARAATANFVNDSVKVIVCARPLNDEERNVLTATKTWFEEYHVAQSAVAVIVNPANPVKELRMGQADSIFTGQTTVWPNWRAGGVVDLVIGSVDASTNEVFRRLVMRGKPFAQSATPMTSSSDIVEYVAKTPGAAGIVGVGWLKGVESDVKVIGLSRPGVTPDSTQPAGKAYAPHQAYVYQGYYPASTPVTMYTRDLDRTVSLGFISFAAGPFGQKVFLNSGLVPVTMPVRLIQLTSE
ncbi:MAG: substrate-binding domain-containing protein [Ignavibacteriae bacterium]|nr:substrate-binding domain-containing protein [Ignavibacteriota bacterium]